ncbi:MAG: hypothetical protein SYC29_10125, partial [Planctomycetota bacterium]|nr:hypothetical protein [Planctomycetota bacterium]
MMELHPETLTWTALLGTWMDYARASVAAPKDAEGDRWRAAVPAVINLQAVTFALADLARLPVEDRPLARDRAELLIVDNAAKLHELWRGEEMPESLIEISEDARAALERSVFTGAVELVFEGPGTMVMPAAPIDGEEGTLAIMQPGTIVMPGEPVAWWVERDGSPIAQAVPGCRQREVNMPRQVYRQLDEEGRITGDVVAPLDAELPPGMPLLVPLYEQGRPIGHFTLEA